MRFGAGTPDIEVKRYYWTETNTAVDSNTLTIDAVTVANAFCRPIGMGAPFYGAVPVTDSENVQNYQVIPLVTGTTTVTLNFYHGTRNVSMEGWIEVWEYVGAASGANEFVVLHHGEVAMSATTSEDVTLDTTGTTQADMVPIWGGITATSFGTTEQFRGDRLRKHLAITSTSNCNVSRHDGTSATELGLTVVEFTGSNWTVNENDVTHPASTLGASTHTITSVTDWTNTMFFHTHQGRDGGVGSDDHSLLGYVGNSSATQFKTNHQVNGPNPVEGTLYTVHNSDLSVEHNDTVDGDASTTVPRPTTTITEPGDHDLTTAVSAEAVSTNVGTINASLSWIAWLSDSTTFATDYVTTDGDEDLDYSFQIIDLDGVAS